MTSAFLLATAVAFKTFTTEIDVEFATPEDAQAAEARALEMPPGKTVAFSSRWDDTNRRHPLMAKAFSAAGAKATNQVFLRRVAPLPTSAVPVLPQAVTDSPSPARQPVPRSRPSPLTTIFMPSRTILR